MKTGLAAAALASAFLSTAALAQMGYGMDHPGMGPGAGQGYGMGPGMMGGPGHGMGPGMMGGPGHGMGPGMMGGHGWGMGGGMMGGPGFQALDRLNLSDEQRGKVRDIQRDMQRKQFALMNSMHELRWQAEDQARGPEFDEAAARKLYEAGAAIHKQMFEARLEAHKRLEAVLTKEQREELRKAWRPGPQGRR